MDQGPGGDSTPALAARRGPAGQEKLANPDCIQDLAEVDLFVFGCSVGSRQAQITLLTLRFV
jgi:hypothetical protein